MPTVQPAAVTTADRALRVGGGGVQDPQVASATNGSDGAAVTPGEDDVSRLARLRLVATAASKAKGIGDLLDVVVRQGVAGLDGCAGVLYLEEPGRELHLRASTGYPADLLVGWERVSLDDQLPVAVAARTDAPLWLQSATDRLSAFPALAGMNSGTVSTVAIPLRVADRRLGVLGVAFSQEHDFRTSEQLFLLTLADLCAQALDRLLERVVGRSRAARLELALAAADVGSFEWHVPSGEVIWDARLCRIFGLGQEEFDSRFETFRAAVEPEDLNHLDSSIQHAIDSRGDFAAEYRIHRPDGELRWVTARGRLVPGTDGMAERMFGTAVDSTDLRDSRDRVIRALEHMADAFFTVDRDWTFTYVNAEAERLLERSREQLLGRNVWQELPEAVGAALHEQYDLARSTGHPVIFVQYHPPLDRYLQVRVFPAPDGLLVYFTDVTDWRTQQAEREELRAAETAARNEAGAARARLTFLAEASAEIATTLDVREVCRRLAHHAVPTICDWSAIYLAEGDELQRMAATHADPAQTARLATLLDVYPIPVDAESLPGRAFLSRAAVLERNIGPEVIARTYPDPEARELISALGVREVLAVPLVAADTVLGVMVFVVAAPGRTITNDDAATAVELSRRAALALDNARLYARHISVAEALQQAVLPERLPAVPGLSLAARYVPATTGVDVGGDFYDVFRLPNGRTVLAVGDAAGHGLAAGALMGQLRNALRAYAVAQGGPGATLEALGALLAALEPDAFATAIVVEIDPTTGELAWCSAGHPPPVLLGRGEPHLLNGDPDAPLGVRAGAVVQHRLRLSPGEGLLLYTDGLVERRRESLSERLATLCEAAAGPYGELDGLVDRVLARMEEGSGFGDDVCLLAVHRQPDTDDRVP